MFAEPAVGAGVAGQDQGSVAVHERPLHGDEVHAVVHRVDEERVVQPVGALKGALIRFTSMSSAFGCGSREAWPVYPSPTPLVAFE